MQRVVVSRGLEKGEQLQVRRRRGGGGGGVGGEIFNQKAIATKKRKDEVSISLKQLGVEHMMDGEVKLENVTGGIAADFLLEKDGELGVKTIVQCYGPHNYLRSGGVDSANCRTPPRVTGFYKFAERLLKKQHFNLVVVPHFEWDTLASEKEKTDYLKTLL